MAEHAQVLTGHIVQIASDTDPATIERALACLRDDSWVQFAEPLPPAVLKALADALEGYPDVGLRAYGDADASLGWLSRFPHVRHLLVHLWELEDFSPIAQLGRLTRLALGDTRRRSLSLGFLSQLPSIEELGLEGQDRDFDVIRSLGQLRRLHLRVPRAKTLDSLRGHETLEVVAIDIGGIRDLTPLADIPELRAIDLWGVRKLDTDDLDAIGECAGLVAVALGALRNVRRLGALARGPAATLRFLTLDNMGGLETYTDLAECRRLEQVHVVDSRPVDRSLAALASAPALSHLYVGDAYRRDEVSAALAAFHGSTFWHRGEFLRGDGSGTEVSWRRPVEEYLSPVR